MRADTKEEVVNVHDKFIVKLLWFNLPRRPICGLVVKPYKIHVECSLDYSSQIFY